MFTSFRLNRLFDGASRRCLDVAVDHGFFGEHSFLESIEHMPTVVRDLVLANPDAIQLSVGQASLLQQVPGKAKPALVLRVDVANIYSKALPARLFSLLIDDAVIQGLRLDAACVVVNLLDLPSHDEVREACIRNVTALKPRCEEVGMPLMVEPLVMRAGMQGVGYASDLNADGICALVRQASELGADVIKADPTEDPRDFHRVVEIAGDVPVLVRGGGRVTDREILERTRVILDQGARGIVYGRNITQHPNPPAITRVLMEMLHQDQTVEAAYSSLESALA